MKRISILALTICVIAIIACKKTDTIIPENALPLKFISLIKTQDTVKVNVNDTLIALASGEEVSYAWTSDSGFGTFLPLNGSNKVLFSVCHQDNFVVTCKITDKYNRTDSKKITVNVVE